MLPLEYTCSIIFLILTVCNGYTIDIFDSKLDKAGKPSSIGAVDHIADFQNDDIRGILHIGGHHRGILRSNIFEDFVVSMLDLLSGFPGRMLSRYCRLIYRELDRFEYKYTRKLAKYFRDLSRDGGDQMREEMRRYQKELQTKGPQLSAFISHMNEVFTLLESGKFNDYVLDVRDYGNSMKRSVGEETRDVLNSIVNAVKKLSAREQNKLERKLRKAIKEHDNFDTEPNIYELLFYSTPRG